MQRRAEQEAQGSRSYQEGPREAQRLLGHASMTMTETYVRNRIGERVKPLK